MGKYLQVFTSTFRANTLWCNDFQWSSSIMLSTIESTSGRCRLRACLITGASAVILTVAAGGVTMAQKEAPAVLVEADPIVTIRTHWVVKLMDPDRKPGTPQFIAVVSPDGTVNGSYALLELNHTTIPKESPGGVQLQIWQHDTPYISSSALHPGTKCQTAGETIRFTMQMKFEENAESPTGRQIVFSVGNLESTTWGKINSVGSYSLPTSLTSLDDFTPQSSMLESGVNSGGTRIEFMKIDSIDYRTLSGAATSDATDYVVHSAKALVETQLDAVKLERVLAY
jgi:hypothetical protein